MKITVGGRELIATASLQIPNGEDAWIEFLAGTWNVKININFIDDKDDAALSFSLEGKGEYAVLTFKNWHNALPSAITNPIEFGETDNKKISCIFSGYSVDGFKRLDISFFWENANG